MKKQLFILLSLIALLVTAQVPQRFNKVIVTGDITSPKFIRTGSTVDSVLLGNGSARSVNSIKTDTVSLSNRINAKATGNGTANGANTGDETLTSIKTKLGAATSASDGYLKYQDFVKFDGKLSSEVDGSTTNELQTISTNGAAGNITLSNSGGTLNLNVNDADASTTNEIQDLSLSGNTLSLSSDATTVDISQATAVLANTAKVSNATHTGDVSGSTALTLATVNSNVGTFNNITINAKGLATAGSNVSYEPTITKNTAFNKNFGTTPGTVLEGRTFGTAANSAVGDFQPIENQRLSTANAPTFSSVIVGSLVSNIHSFKVGGQSPSNLRWSLEIAGTETGSNEGSDYGLYNFSDTGAYIGQALSFKRSSGASMFSGDAKFNSTTPSTSPTTGALVVGGGIGVGGNGNFNGALTATSFVKSGGTATQFLKANGSVDATNYKPNFTENTGFNKNFGTTAGTVLEGRTFGTAANSSVGDFQPIENQRLSTTNSPSFNIITSTVATGTSPLTVNSTTVVSNLNADLLDGYHSSNIITEAPVYQSLNNAFTEKSPQWGASNTDVPFGLSFANYIGFGSSADYYKSQILVDLYGEKIGYRAIVAGSPTAWKELYHSGNLTNTLSTNYIPKWNGSSFVNAIAGTDFQLPITLTTNGTSGAATFSGGVLNVPNYSGGTGGSGGSFTPSITNLSNVSSITSNFGNYISIGGATMLSFSVDMSIAGGAGVIRVSLPNTSTTNRFMVTSNTNSTTGDWNSSIYGYGSHYVDITVQSGYSGSVKWNITVTYY